nr:hypothetical protein GCM10025732_32920 [Glycomyces mayteni]
MTRAEYEAVLAAFAPDLAVADAAPIAVTTRAGTAPVLPGAHLTKADGSVQDVAVDWDAVDAAQYARPGTFTVAGVAQDDSRAPVTAHVTVTAPLQLTASVRCLAGKATVVVTAANLGSTTVDIALSSGFGAKTLTAIAPGAAASAAFTTRQAAVAAGTVTAAAGGAVLDTAYPATDCG